MSCRKVFDPHELYSAQRQRCMQALKREYGLGVGQVKATAIEDARIAWHFADWGQLKGISACRAFSIMKPKLVVYQKIGNLAA